MRGTIVIEVKTTDYVAISLDKLADYRDRLATDKQVKASRYDLSAGGTGIYAIELTERLSHHLR